MIKRLFALSVMCLLLAGCNWIGGSIQKPTAVPTPQQTPVHTVEPTVGPATPEPSPDTTPDPTPEPTPTPAPVEISIMAVGDIMFHGAQVNAAYDKKTKSYDFNNSFEYIKGIISSADLAMGNLECPLGGPGKKYSEPNSKNFSAPDSAVDALIAAGFDVLSSANNHITNRGRDGMVRTVSVLKDKGVIPVGVREKSDDKWYQIKDVKGIKIGITAYTYGSGKDNNLNIFSQSNISAELQDMGKLIGQMRADGAEFLVFFFHWGSEYSRSPASSQKKLAQGLADLGVDVIFASHPHVLQPVEIIDSAKSGKKTFVAYSLGNFISNQLTRWNSQFLYTEDSMIVHINVVRQPGGEPYLSDIRYLPTRTMMVTISGKRKYVVIPIEKALQAPEAYDMTASYDKKKSQKSLDDTNKLLADAVAKGYIRLMQLE